MDIAAKLATVRRYQSIMGRQLGPFRLANELEQQIEMSWKPVLEQAINEVQLVETLSVLTFRAPSAEHAAVFLQAMQVACGYGAHHSTGQNNKLLILLFKIGYALAIRLRY